MSPSQGMLVHPYHFITGAQLAKVPCTCTYHQLLKYLTPFVPVAMVVWFTDICPIACSWCPQGHVCLIGTCTWKVLPEELCMHAHKYC